MLCAAAICVPGSILRAQPAALTPAAAARMIVDRVIRETVFELQPEVLKPTLDIHVVDFGRVFASRGGIVFARSGMTVDKDTVLRFGISRDMPLAIAINGTIAYHRADRRPFVFNEIGYEVFRFNDTIMISLKKGRNMILLKAKLAGDRNTVYLREMFAPGSRPAARFDAGASEKNDSGSDWLFCGIFDDNGGGTFRAEPLPPEMSEGSTSSYSGTEKAWRMAEPVLIQTLRISSDAVFRRESYAEWQYPNGTVMLSLLDYGRTMHDTGAAAFVRRFAAFTLDNIDVLRRQYERLNAFRGTDHRLFRCGMLDDAGAPALPFAELQLAGKDGRIDSLVSALAAYVMKGQARLTDGTLCRHEPLPGTVWADDLFMSAPLMMRMGMLTGDAKYFDDAARQVVQFNGYLRDTATGLYRHGWYGTTKQQSPVAWGRSNGWVVWAMTEVLERLPATHPQRSAIAALFRAHMAAIVRYQSSSGLWHQVLDMPGSFEETSCTAMFIIGMTRGMRMSLLDQGFIQPLMDAQRGLLSKISADGRIKDICRGTELRNDPEFYFKRDRFDNDPRGLGAVITALTELTHIAN
jgi:rhamnogalacturonyl hydrolase YesR